METDFATMLRLMEMMSLFSDTPETPATSSAEDEEPKFYDNEIHSPGLNTMKAAIPYLDYHHQRTLGIMLKLIEIQKLMEMYGTQIPNTSKGDWRRQMLMAIRPHVAEDRQRMIDMLIKFIHMKEILNPPPC